MKSLAVSANDFTILLQAANQMATLTEPNKKHESWSYFRVVSFLPAGANGHERKR